MEEVQYERNWRRRERRRRREWRRRREERRRSRQRRRRTVRLVPSHGRCCESARGSEENWEVAVGEACLTSYPVEASHCDADAASGSG